MRESPFALTHLAVRGHSVTLVAREQGVLPLESRTTALAADAVDDLGNLADEVEHGRGIGVVAELVLREDLGGGDAGTWRGMVRERRYRGCPAPEI